MINKEIVIKLSIVNFLFIISFILVTFINWYVSNSLLVKIVIQCILVLGGFAAFLCDYYIIKINNKSLNDL